ncbi:MAG: hypothetical protein QOG19_1230 [Mycobacterium sp.]|nr:hypothetical protein [Mycobacterium sp.]
MSETCGCTNAVTQRIFTSVTGVSAGRRRASSPARFGLDRTIWSCRSGLGNLAFTNAGWSSSVARWAHNPEVAGSNPVPATSGNGPQAQAWGPFSCRLGTLLGTLAKLTSIGTVRRIGQPVSGVRASLPMLVEQAGHHSSCRRCRRTGQAVSNA